MGVRKKKKVFTQSLFTHIFKITRSCASVVTIIIKLWRIVEEIRNWCSLFGGSVKCLPTSGGGDALREDVKSKAYGTKRHSHMPREYHLGKNKVIRISIR